MSYAKSLLTYRFQPGFWHKKRSPRWLHPPHRIALKTPLKSVFFYYYTDLKNRVCLVCSVYSVLSLCYDQYQRNTLYKAAEPLGFDTAKVTTACETDCSTLVRVCIAFAGITGLPEGFRTGNMPSNLNKTGAFTELTGSKYQSQSTYLGRGDILVTKTSGHTVVVLSNGPKYDGAIHPVEYALGDRTLRYGCEGQDVKLMQEMLLKLGYDLGSWGCDGDFGDCTELALKAFQTDAKLDVDGECSPTTLIALEKAVEALSGAGCDGDSCPINVTIVGGNCYIRTAPNTDGKILGVAHKGDTLPYGGQVSDGGWLLVQHENQNAWVSGKYGIIEL